MLWLMLPNNMPKKLLTKWKFAMIKIINSFSTKKKLTINLGTLSNSKNYFIMYLIPKIGLHLLTIPRKQRSLNLRYLALKVPWWHRLKSDVKKKNIHYSSLHECQWWTCRSRIRTQETHSKRKEKSIHQRPLLSNHQQMGSKYHMKKSVILILFSVTIHILITN
jgi:hypothetical protein